MAPRQEDMAICREFKRRLSETAPLIGVSLFGSRARGEAEPESDFDFLVELETVNDELRSAVRRTAWEVAYENNTVLQTTIVSREQLTTSPGRSSLLVRQIEIEGVAI